MLPIQMDLSQKEKTFFRLFCTFFKSTLNFEQFQKKVTLITYVSPNLRTPKDVVREMPEKSGFRGLLDRQRGKRVKTLFESQRQHLYHIHWSLWRQLSSKESLLVIWKIFRLFVNTLSDDDKYSLLNGGKLTQHIKMHLSQKQKKFSEFFCAFLSIKFSAFSENDDSHRLCISEITESERRG